MKAIRFQTDWRLWMWIALILFVVSLFIPVISIKSGPYFSITSALRDFVTAVHQTDDSEIQLLGGILVFFTSVAVIIALVLGWLLHCFIVIVRTKRHERINHAA
jgi:hypothetical protein